MLNNFITDRPVKILIVDDNPKNLQVLGSTLRNNNFEVEFATSGKGALKWLKTQNFDLILLDIMMPEMNGYDVCKIIRKDKNFNELPIIFLTAKTDKSSIIEGFKTGAQDYISKPFDPEELMARVNMQLELKFSREKLGQVNKYLEEEVKKRTKELDEANKELQKLDTIKGEFLNMISHEIRTPLNGIMGPLQLIKSRVDNEELIKLLEMLDLSVERLETFAYSALLITRLKAKKYKFEPDVFSIHELLDYSLLKLNEKIEKKSLSFNIDKFDKNLTVFADKDLMHEALTRLLDNSIKYSAENAQIKIEGIRTENRVKILIKDHGKGFPDHILNKEIKLFNPGEKHISQNIGLDMYLIKLIMDYHNGKMVIGNNPEGGAYVDLELIDKE